jgi:cystathionine beta-synthase
MINDAKKSGKINDKSVIVESTSGNTGMGLTLCSALNGNKQIITIPDKMSNDKVNRLKVLGAEVHVCPTELDHHHPESYTGLAHKLG